MTPIKFVEEISDAKLNDLRSRLRNTNWTDMIGHDDWIYGIEAGLFHLDFPDDTKGELKSYLDTTNSTH